MDAVVSLLDNLPHKCTIRRQRTTGGLTDSLGGVRKNTRDEQTGVPCWEQSLSTREIMAYDKQNIVANRKIYFSTNPNITDRHEIIITERNGVAVPESQQEVIDGLLPAGPDASAGLAVLFRVIGGVNSGKVA